MAVIKCSNCENEILDNEIVCPYCDCPLSETIKKMKKDDLKTFSDKAVDELTGKIPVIKEEPKEEPKLATSSDFEKEKAAILKDLGIKIGQSSEEYEAPKTESKESDLEKTVKISRSEILGGKVNSSATALEDKKTATSSRASSAVRTTKKRKKNPYSKYIVLAVTIVGIILIGVLISKIADTISDGINSRRKTNRTVEVGSSAEAIQKMQGYYIEATTLTITDEKAMKDKDGNFFKNAEDYPWYIYKNNAEVKISHVTVQNGITEIPANAFTGFETLQTVKLPSTVSHINDNAFYECVSLTKVTFHDECALTEIGDSAFEGCSSLNEIAGYTKEGKFTLKLNAIGDRAFANCKSLKEFKLPDNISLGDDVFAGHGSEFAIICSEDSDAFEYAEDYDIPVKEDFDVRIVENEYHEDEEEENTEEENGEENNDDEGDTSKETTTSSSDEKSTNSEDKDSENNNSENTDNTNNNNKSENNSAENPKSELENLQGQLGGDNDAAILEEIAKQLAQ